MTRTITDGRLVGVGVGPGDPDLLTTRALATLRAADRVVAPSGEAGTAGRAESIVAQAAPELTLQRLVFDMGPDRAASHLAAAEQLLGPLDGGEDVAFVTLGDPNIYSTFSTLTTQLRRLRPGLSVATVPGIMAFQELASCSGIPLLDGTESLHLVTALDGPAQLERAVEDDAAAVVVYKGGRHLPAIREALVRAGRLEGAVLGEMLGLPGERIVPVGAAGDKPASYLATVIVPPRRRQGPQ